MLLITATCCCVRAGKPPLPRGAAAAKGPGGGARGPGAHTYSPGAEGGFADGGAGLLKKRNRLVTCSPISGRLLDDDDSVVRGCELYFVDNPPSCASSSPLVPVSRPPSSCAVHPCGDM